MDKVSVCDFISYERGIAFMKIGNSIKKWIKEHPIIVSIFCSIIASIITGVTTGIITSTLSSYKSKILLTENVNNLKESIDKLDDLPERVATIEGQMGIITPSLKVTLSSVAESSINVETASFSVNFLSSGPKWEKDEVIGKNEKTGLTYSAEELAGKEVLFPYLENGQEVYFYGQYNEKMHWNGDCVINVYKDNSLILITDANYVDGVLVKYRQIMPDTKDDCDVWTMSRRISMGKENAGETWNYIRDDNVTKDFDFDTVTDENMISYEKFEELYPNLNPYSYYNGITADGKYNDKTGNAYYIRYERDGTVRTLYCGCFENGKFNDSTDNSWDISISPENGTKYMYYKGMFKDGEALKDSGHVFENPVSRERIEEIIGDRVFNVKPNWSSYGFIGENQ